jgi:hypothetical protein
MAPLKLKDAEDSGDIEALIEAIKALREHEHLQDEHDRAVGRLDQIQKYREGTNIFVNRLLCLYTINFRPDKR